MAAINLDLPGNIALHPIAFFREHRGRYRFLWTYGNYVIVNYDRESCKKGGEERAKGNMKKGESQARVTGTLAFLARFSEIHFPSV